MALPYVLVVEDELPIQRAILKWLTVLQYEAAGVTSAVGALEMIRQRRPEVVFSDFVLPIHDGLWLLTEVRRQWSDLPVILTTGALLPESTIYDARRHGAVAFLGKPFTREALDQAIRRALARAQSAPDPSR